MKILDMCCGGKLFYYDMKNKDITFCDIRKGKYEFTEGRNVEVLPDIVCDFRELPFHDEMYDLVIFDPPHLIRAGEKSFMAIKYGKLTDYKSDLSKGFSEAFRVLKPNGTLIFKWSETQVAISDVLKLAPHTPVLGDKRGKTRWIVFVK